MSGEGTVVDIDEIEDPEELAKLLENEEFEDLDDEGGEPETEEEPEQAEEPDGESDSEEVAKDDPPAEKPAETPKPEESEPEKDHRVPVNLYTDTRKAKDEAERRAADLQRQLDESNQALEDARKTPSEGAEVPLTDEDKEALRDELGDKAANLIIAQQERVVELQKQIEADKAAAQAQADEQEIIASMSETPDLKKWFTGLESKDSEVAKASHERIEIAAGFEGLAQKKFPDSRSDQNKFIERQVKEWFGEDTKPDPAKDTPTETAKSRVDTSPSLGDMAGGSAGESDSDKAFLARFETMPEEDITDEILDRANRLMGHDF